METLVQDDEDRVVGVVARIDGEQRALRGRQGERVKVTEGRFTFVAIDENGRPRPVPPEEG